MANLELSGKLMAYMASGATFDEFFEEQGEGSDRASVEAQWNRVDKWRKQNPGTAMDVPSD